MIDFSGLGAGIGILQKVNLMGGEISQLRKENKELTEAFQECFDFLELAPFDFRNGVTDPTGSVDEGEVLGSKYLCEILEKYRGLRKSKQEQP